MKSKMLKPAPLCLVICWMLPVFSMKLIYTSISQNVQAIPLNMAEDSVDDMYFGCDKQMIKKMDKYLKNENKDTFKEVWQKTNDCTKRNLKHKDKVDKALTENHMRAICMYTTNYDNFYATFNKAVRTRGRNYTLFQFHYLHFWLTSSVQILNTNDCHTSYRRTKDVFSGEVNQIIRFGSFASSSLKGTMRSMFGNTTCFEIKTCFGAELKTYPYLGKQEQEVLIPPYEMFKITGIVSGKKSKTLKDCQRVFTVKSVGVHSNLNCKVLK